MGSVLHFVATAIAFMSFSGAASAFVVLPSEISLDSRCHGSSLPSFSAMQLHAHPPGDEYQVLPFTEYKDTVSSLEAVLGEVLDTMSVSQDLIRRLAALNALDVPLVDYEDDDDSQHQYQHEIFSTPDHKLRTAIERALTTSQRMGRSSPETELAWIHVNQVAFSSLNSHKHDGDGDTMHRHYSMLAHPSYRYTYAASLLRAASSFESSSLKTTTAAESPPAAAATTTASNVAFLKSQAQTIQQSVQQLQRVVETEQTKLRESERKRALLIDQLNKNW